MFFEGIQSKGLGVKTWALPRGKWVLDESENPTLPGRVGRLSVDIEQVNGARLSSVVCFHWFVLSLAVAIGMIRRVPVLYDEHDHFKSTRSKVTAHD